MDKILPKILAIVVVIFVSLTGSYIYLKYSGSSGPIKNILRRELNLAQVPDVQVNAGPTPIPTPRPIKLLPGGIQTYNLSHGSGVEGPKPFKVIIDPLTPQKGQKQMVTSMISSDAEIAEAKIILHTDNTKKEYPLKLTGGNTQNGTWEASWVMDDSYDYNYYIQFYLKSANGVFQNGLRFRQDY